MYKSIAPISPERHGRLFWKPCQDYSFVAHEPLISVSLAEIARASGDMPVAFICQEKQVFPVVVCSPVHDTNHYVSPEGQWLGSYLPALLRAYPFTVAQNEDGEPIVCVDEGSDLIVPMADSRRHEPLFDDSRRPVGRFAMTVEFLTFLHEDWHRTEEICAVLSWHELLTKWTIPLDEARGADGIGGLLRIDERRLNGLCDEAVLELHAVGAFPLIFAHLASLHRVPMIERLSLVRQRGSKAQTVLADVLQETRDDCVSVASGSLYDAVPRGPGLRRVG